MSETSAGESREPELTTDGNSVGGSGEEPKGVPTTLLNYRAPRDEKSSLQIWSFKEQVLWGCFSWGCALMLIAVGMTLNGSQPLSNDFKLWLVGGIVLALLAVAITVTIQNRWMGFIPGVLVGFVVTCLIPEVILTLLGLGGWPFW